MEHREGQLPGEEIPAEDEGPLEFRRVDEEAPHDEAGSQGDAPGTEPPPREGGAD